MDIVRYRHRHLDVACGLDASGAAVRSAGWARLRQDAGLRVDPIPGGARLWLRPEARETAGQLAEAEAACCGFLDIELELDGHRLRLDITSPAPEAGPVIADIAGLSPRR